MVEVLDAPRHVTAWQNALTGEPFTPEVQSPNGDTPMGVPVRTRDKVAIVGFADGHREQAPDDTGQFEIWGLNRLFAAMERPWTAWFDIHDLAFTYGDLRPGGRDEEWISFCRSFKGPIYLRPQDVDLAKSWGIATAVPYPINEVLASGLPRYYTNSISYMLALAILMGFEEMALVGVDMAQDSLTSSEYRHQRPSCELFIGAAMASGMKVFIPDGSDLLCAASLYGFEDDTGMQLKRRSRKLELGGRKEGMKAEMAKVEGEQASYNSQCEAHKRQLFAGINQLDGAMQEVDFEGIQLSAESAVPPPEETDLKAAVAQLQSAVSEIAKQV